MSKNIIVAATGASGLPLLVECLKIIKENEDFKSYLIMSESAKLTLAHETEYSLEDIYQYADYIFVPCSMKTIAGINSGYADNLILRAADVTIKEQRTLVLAARETPLSSIHLRNMHELSQIQGVRIIPPMMTFYNLPKDINEMMYHIAAKLLEPFGIEAKEYRRWTGLQ